MNYQQQKPDFPSLPAELLEGGAPVPEWDHPVDAYDLTLEDAFIPPAPAPAK